MNEKNWGKHLKKYVDRFVLFDLETTGLNPSLDNIVEISALKVEDNNIIEKYDTLINPERHIPEGAAAVHGITDDMVKDAPTIEEALPDFLAFIEGYPLVGHNIYSFDLNFISNAAIEVCGTTLHNDYVDTLHFSRKCLPELKHHRLTDLSHYFGLSTKGAHRAYNDCLMNYECYIRLGKIDSERPKELCPDCGGELILRNGKFGKFMGCENFPACKYTKNVR